MVLFFSWWRRSNLNNRWRPDAGLRAPITPNCDLPCQIDRTNGYTILQPTHHLQCLFYRKIHYPKFCLLRINEIPMIAGRVGTSSAGSASLSPGTS